MKNTPKLLQQISKSPQEKLLSIFIDVNHLSHHQIPHHIKSFLTDQRHHHQILSQHPEFTEEIIDQVSEHLNQNQSSAQALAIYAKLDSSKAKIIFFEIVNLHHQIQNQIYLNHVFDVLPVIRDKQKYPHALLLQIDHHRATLYQYQKTQLTELQDWSNDFIDKHEKEYIETTGSRTETQQHGTGTKRYQLANEDANIHFINQIIKDLQTTKYKSDLQQASYFVIFHTPNIKEFIDIFTENTFLKAQQLEIVSEPKIFQTTDKLQAVIEEQITSVRQKKFKQLLQDAQEQNELFTTDWHQIIDATNQNRIYQLFLDINAHKPGFINMQQQIQLAKPEEQQWSESTNIIPWIIHHVQNTSGETYIFEENTFFEISQLAALLRY